MKNEQVLLWSVLLTAGISIGFYYLVIQPDLQNATNAGYYAGNAGNNLQPAANIITGVGNFVSRIESFFGIGSNPGNNNNSTPSQTTTT